MDGYGWFVSVCVRGCTYVGVRMMVLCVCACVRESCICVRVLYAQNVAVVFFLLLLLLYLCGCCLCVCLGWIVSLVSGLNFVVFVVLACAGEW